MKGVTEGYDGGARGADDGPLLESFPGPGSPFAGYHRFHASAGLPHPAVPTRRVGKRGCRKRSGSRLLVTLLRSTPLLVTPLLVTPLLVTPRGPQLGIGFEDRPEFHFAGTSIARGYLDDIEARFVHW